MPTPNMAHKQYFTFAGLNLTQGGLASEVRMQGKSGEIDISTIGNTYQSYDQAQSAETFTVTGVWDSSTTVGSLDGTMGSALHGGGTKLFEFCPNGSASGRIKYSGNGLLTAYEVGGAVGARVGFSATIRNAGSMTWGTVT